MWVTSVQLSSRNGHQGLNSTVHQYRARPVGQHRAFARQFLKNLQSLYLGWLVWVRCAQLYWRFLNQSFLELDAHANADRQTQPEDAQEAGSISVCLQFEKIEGEGQHHDWPTQHWADH